MDQKKLLEFSKDESFAIELVKAESAKKLKDFLISKDINIDLEESEKLFSDLKIILKNNKIITEQDLESIVGGISSKSIAKAILGTLIAGSGIAAIAGTIKFGCDVNKEVDRQNSPLGGFAHQAEKIKDNLCGSSKSDYRKGVEKAAEWVRGE